MDLQTQFLIIIISTLIGAFMGILYTILKNDKYCYITDLLYWFIITFVLVRTLEKYNNGLFIFYQLIFIIIGNYIYYKYLNKLFKERLSMLVIYIKPLLKLIKVLILPPFLHTFYSKIKKYLQKKYRIEKTCFF